jgi:hypothetical protein
MTREEALDALARELEGRVTHHKDGSSDLEGERSGHTYWLRLAPFSTSDFVLRVRSCVPRDLRLQFRPASARDRRHDALFGWRRRVDARFRREVFVVSALPRRVVRLVEGSAEVREAVRMLTARGLQITFVLGDATAAPAGPEVELDAALVRTAVDALARAGAAASLVAAGDLAPPRSKLSRDVAGYAYALYAMGGLVTLNWIPLDPGPKVLVLLVLAALVAWSGPIWAFPGRDTGEIAPSWKEDGWSGLLFVLARNAPLVLWLTFGLNALAGREPPVDHVTRVVDVFFWGGVEVKSWRPGEETRLRYLGKNAFRFHPGDRVKLATRVGLLGWDYVSAELVALPPEPAPAP